MWWVSAVRATTLARVPAPVDSARAEALAEEAKLVARAQSGDRQALGALLKQHGPALYRSVLLPRLGSAAAAEEALAVTYAKVVDKFDRFTWQGSGFYPWLRVVAMRVALDQLRARRREIPLDSDDLAREVDRAEASLGRGGLDAAAIADEDARLAREKIERALSTINPRYARAIRLRVLEERGRDEAAAALGVTTATFDVVLHRALAAMKKALLPTEEA
ncbi:MAG: RNA polymerase sigma factor [Polyangiaceae bacterium]|nr:RNA polymerase sigma factor [Polyangiaceae bacterium]